MFNTFSVFYCIFLDEDLDRQAMLDLTKQGNLCLMLIG